MYIAEDVKVVAIDKVKKGHYFRLLGTAKVYVANGYDRVSRMYTAYRLDGELNSYIMKRKGA